jgi:hypothetical protein
MHLIYGLSGKSAAKREKRAYISVAICILEKYVKIK